MTKITIHGQKMQYHKKIAISVTLISGTGGTATFTPETGTSYTLSSLPIGTRIVKSTDTLYSLSDANGNSVGTITLVASSGYNADEVSITRGGVKTTIGIVPIVLQEGDSIVADFEVSTKPINFYLGWVGQSYGDPWNFAILNYNGQPLNPNVSYIEMQNDRDEVQLEISSAGEESSFKFYFSGGSGSDGLLANIVNPNYKIARIEYYDADAGDTYICDGTSPVIGNVGDTGMARILLDTASSCTLADYQTAGLPSPYALDGPIETAVRNRIPDIQQMNRMEPNEFDYILMDQNAIYGFGLYNCTYRTTDERGNTQYVNSQVYVAFYQHSGNLVAMPYERMQASQYQVMPLWNDTHLTAPNNINSIFANGDEYALNNWINNWNCGDACDLMHTIYNLAEGYI